MRFTCPRNWTAVLLAFLCWSLTQTAKADTYTWTVVTPTNRGNFVAADDYGDYTLNITLASASGFEPCGKNAYTCFQTYSAYTQQNTYTTFQPVLLSDPDPTAGSGCTFNASLIDGGVSYCNNGHQVVGNVAGVWAVDTGVPSLIWSGAPANSVMLTSSGNIFFADGYHENLIFGVDTTTVKAALPLTITPEPSSLWMLGTGALGLLGAGRRRFFA